VLSTSNNQKGRKMSENTIKQFNWRAFFSVLMAISFIGMAFTGVILFVVPPGRIANWTGWTLLALTKHQWIGLHDWFSIIFVIASVFHLYLNWNCMICYFKSRINKAFALRSEWILALVICIAVFLGTLGDVKPFSSLLAWSESIKHNWESPQQSAPIPHAELLTLTELAEQVRGVDIDTMLTNLKARGIEVESTDAVLGKLAETYNMTPVQLYNIALGQRVGRRGQGGHGAGGLSRGTGQYEDARTGGNTGYGQSGFGRGLGQLTLKEYCGEISLDVDTAVKKLRDAGYNARPEMTIRSIADSAGEHPSQIRTVLEPAIQ
jgi:hypothetical protein